MNRLQAEMVLLNALIDTLTDLFDSSVLMEASIKDLDAIYNKKNELKLARKALRKKITATQNGFYVLKHLVGLALATPMN